MNLLRLEAQIEGILYVAEAPMPDLKGYSGKMCTYSGLFGAMSKLLWRLAADIENGTDADPIGGILGQK